AGTVQLGGLNTYTGPTVIGGALVAGGPDGNLELVGGGAIADSAITVNDHGVLTLDAGSYVAGNIGLAVGGGLTLEAGSRFDGDIDLSALPPDGAINLDIQSGAVFTGGFIHAPNSFTLSSTAWTGELAVLEVNGAPTLVVEAPRQAGNGAAGVSLTQYANSIAATQFLVASGADYDTAFNWIATKESVSGGPFVLTAVNGLLVGQLGASNAEIYVPSLVAGASITITSPTGSGSGSGSTIASGTGVLGPGTLDLSPGGQPLTLQGGATPLTVDSNIIDAQLPSLAGGLSAHAPIIGAPTAGSNAAGAQYSQEISFAAHDDLGTTVQLNAYLTRTAANVWQLAVYDAGTAAASGVFPYTSGPLATTNLTFAGGSLVNADPLALTLSDGRTLDLDIAGLTQSDAYVSGNLDAASPALSGQAGASNVAGDAFTDRLTLATHNSAGAAVTLDLYFTNTGAGVWQVAAYDASTAAAGGGFPYSAPALAVEQLSFNAAGAVSAGGEFSIPSAGGAALTVDLSSLTQLSAVASLQGGDGVLAPVTEASVAVPPVRGAGDALVIRGGVVTLNGQNSFTGGMAIEAGELKIATAGSAGTGEIRFTAPGQTLDIEAGAPANTLVDFGAGDTILLATASAATQILVSNARGQLVVPGGTPVTLNFGSDLAPESVFAVTSLGAGAGDSITLLPSMFSVASPESLQSALAAIAPGGGSSAPGAAYTITGQSGLSFAAETVALAAGSTLTLTGQAASTGTGLDIASGSVLLTALTYSAGIGETLFTVESGASATLTNDTLSGAIGVAAGGALALLSGTLAASITAASGAVVTAEPAAGATVDLTGALDGVLHVGSASQAAGGRTILDDADPGLSAVYLDGPGIFDVAAGSGFNGAIHLDAAAGAELRIDSGLPAGTIYWDNANGVIDLEGVAAPGGVAQTLTVSNTGVLTLAAGTLTFTGENGATFLQTSDSGTGSLLIPLIESAPVASEAQFDAAVQAAAALPAGAGLTYTVALASDVVLSSADGTADASSLPAGLTFSITGSGGFTAATGADVILAGADSFTGGVTLDAGSTVELATATSAGSGPISFAGPGALLKVDAAVLASPVAGFAPRDTIDLTGAAWSAGLPQMIYADFNGDFSVPGGSVTLPTFTGVAWGSALTLAPDGHGGILLTAPYAQQTVTVSTAAGLAQAIDLADSLTGNGRSLTIDLAAGAPLLLTAALPAIQLAAGVSLTINGSGNTINGGGAVRDLLVASGNVFVENLTLTGGAAASGDGQAEDGGGAGLGGDLYVGTGGNVTLQGVSLAGGTATGAAGGAGVLGGGALGGSA
ncbi:MAG TPA: flagellar basal body FlgE domain-containing protein, partial [Caulobacteraceae bacterium]|nr:flagellar basal body FlgE domain-containing protein [Caulobacteraceae bacterium]